LKDSVQKDGCAVASFLRKQMTPANRGPAVFRCVTVTGVIGFGDGRTFSTVPRNGTRPDRDWLASFASKKLATAQPSF